jgi:hypothetical protein
MKRYHATSVLSLGTLRGRSVLISRDFIFGRAVGRALINAGIGRMSALGTNRTRRNDRNDVNDPEETFGVSGLGS